MAEYTLYGFAQSGHAYKAALLLEVAGADWQTRFVDYFGGETRTPAFRAINVMGEVPVLEHAGQRLSQSGVILDYLGARFSDFAARGEDERREIWRWILWDNHKLTSYSATYRYLCQFASQVEPAVKAEFGRRAEAAWRVLDDHLAGRGFVAAARPTIADFSICGYLFFGEEMGVDWPATHPNLAAWLDRLRALPRWRHPYQLMPGHPLPPRG